MAAAATLMYTVSTPTMAFATPNTAAAPSPRHHRRKMAAGAGILQEEAAASPPSPRRPRVNLCQGNALAMFFDYFITAQEHGRQRIRRFATQLQDGVALDGTDDWEAFSVRSKGPALARLHASVCDQAAAHHAYSQWTMKTLFHAGGDQPSAEMRAVLNERLNATVEQKLNNVAAAIRAILRAATRQGGSQMGEDASAALSFPSDHGQVFPDLEERTDPPLAQLRGLARALEEWNESQEKLLLHDRERVLPLVVATLPPDQAKVMLHDLLFPSPRALRRSASVVRWMLRHVTNRHSRRMLKAAIASACGFEQATTLLETGRSTPDDELVDQINAASASFGPVDFMLERQSRAFVSSSGQLRRQRFSMPTIIEESPVDEGTPSEERANTDTGLAAAHCAQAELYGRAASADAAASSMSDSFELLSIVMRQAAFRDHGLASNTVAMSGAESPADAPVLASVDLPGGDPWTEPEQCAAQPQSRKRRPRLPSLPNAASHRRATSASELVREMHVARTTATHAEAARNEGSAPARVLGAMTHTRASQRPAHSNPAESAGTADQQRVDVSCCIGWRNFFWWRRRNSGVPLSTQVTQPGSIYTS